MNVLAIVASPRRKGLVSTMAQRVLDGTASNGHQIELVNLYDYNLEYCRGCWACRKEGHCILKDDFNALYDKMAADDALVLAAPVYWSNVPGIMKTFWLNSDLWGNIRCLRTPLRPVDESARTCGSQMPD